MNANKRKWEDFIGVHLRLFADQVFKRAFCEICVNTNTNT